jgi:hypothetical protein
MRGIAKGQKIHLFIIPEVRALVGRELRSAAIPVAKDQEIKLMLQNVAYWLLINSMRTERIQYNQLCVQNVSNVWRKEAYKTLFDACNTFTAMRPLRDLKLIKAIGVFKEDVDYDIEHGVPQLVDFGTELRRMLGDNSMFIKNDAAKEV